MEDFDPKLFDDIQKRADELKSTYTERNTLFEEMEEMYFIEPSDESKMRGAGEDVKLTLSPDPRNQIMGATRLLIASDPVFSIPKELNEDEVDVASEKIEKFVEMMYQAMGKVAGRPVHYDAALSAELYGMVVLAIISTQDLVDAATGKSPAEIARTKKTARRTPYLMEAWNPKDCFPEFDNQGLAAIYRRTSTTKQNIWNEFEGSELQLTGRGYEKVVLCEWWDLTWHVIWVEGQKGKPLLFEKHELQAIPIVVGITDGSTNLFDKPEQQVQPFLYGVSKSRLWYRQNLSLTVLYTMLHTIGANAMFKYTTTDHDNEIDVRYDIPGGYVTLGPGESFDPLDKRLVDPNLWQGMEKADQLMAESTIYKQTLGEPLGKNAPFSMVALLSQAGRLPLVSPQKILGWTIGSAMEIALNWMKADNRTGKAVYKGKSAELQPADIPEDFEIEALLDVNMPQDDLQNANVANMLTEGDDPLVSKEWVLRNVLKIEQPNEMRTQIWSEKAATLKAMQYFAWQLEQIKLKMANAMAPPGPPPGQPGTQAAPPLSGTEGPPPGQPPEGPGLQELPPEMAQGGMQPPLNPNQPPAELP